MILLAPFIIIGSMVGVALEKGLTGKKNDLTKEADLLAGDAIANFKTVQSFANEDLLVAKYHELLEPLN